MYRALIKNTQNYLYSTEQKDVEYYIDNKPNIVCPGCGCDLVFKNCKSITKHFAHVSGSDCDTWGVKPMSQYHLGIQNMVPVSNREITIIEDGEKHRADIKLGDTIIEVQASKITAHKVIERNIFYSKNHRLLWIINVSEPYDNYRITRYNNSIYWSNMWKTIFEGATEGVELFLHFPVSNRNNTDMLFYVSKLKSDKYNTHGNYVYGFFLDFNYFFNEVISDPLGFFKIDTLKTERDYFNKRFPNNSDNYSCGHPKNHIKGSLRNLYNKDINIIYYLYSKKYIPEYYLLKLDKDIPKKYEYYIAEKHRLDKLKFERNRDFMMYIQNQEEKERLRSLERIEMLKRNEENKRLFDIYLKEEEERKNANYTNTNTFTLTELFKINNLL